MLSHAIYAGIGWIVGCFTPAVGRKVAALLRVEAKKGVSLVEGEVAAAKKDLGKYI